MDVATKAAFLTAEWLDLVLLSYEVDPAALERFVPRGTTLDLRGGRAIVSIVGFRFAETRLLGVPAIMHRAFDQINLRFYVTRETAGECRRGVVFIRELVALPIVALIARATYNEPYRLATLRHHIVPSSQGFDRIEYRWRVGGGWCSVGAETVGAPCHCVAGSDEAFLVERSWGYTTQRDGSTIEYRVDHPPWRIWRARRPMLEGDLTPSYGSALASLLREPPCSAIVAAGSAVALHHGVKL